MEYLLLLPLSIFSDWIQTAVAFLLILLAAFVFSLPTLLGRGIAALGRGIVTLLVPARRAAWQRERRAKREREQKMRDDIALLGREIAEYGKEAASRRHLERLRAESAARREARRTDRDD